MMDQQRKPQNPMQSSTLTRELAALAAASQILWNTPPDGQATDLPLWRAFTGQTSTQVRGWGWLDAIHPADRAATQAAWRDVVARGCLFETTYRLRRHDNVFRDMLVRGVPVRDEAEQLIGWAGVCTDVTQLMRSEQRLAAQIAISRILGTARSISDALRDLLDAMGTQLGWEAALVWLVEPGSDHLRALLGWQIDDAFALASKQLDLTVGIGLPGRVLASGNPEWIPVLARDANFPRHAAAAAAGLQMAFAFPLLSKRGILGVIECFSVASAAPDPELLHIVETLGHQIGQFLDQLAEAQARTASEARTQTILATSLDAIIMMDASGVITEYNQAAEQLFGFQRAAVLGQPLVTTIIPPSLRAAHNTGLAHYLATGEAQVLGRRIEVMGLRADGSEFPVELAITRMPGDGPPEFTAYLREITDRVRLEAQLRQSAATAAERASKLEAIIDAMVDGVLVSDQRGRIIQMNQAGRALQDRYTPTAYSDLPATERGARINMRNDAGEMLRDDQLPMVRVLAGERLTGTQALDVRVRDWANEEILLNVSGAPVRDATGAITGGVIVARDVTARRQLELRTHNALDALLKMAKIVVQPEFNESGKAPEVTQRLVELAQQVLGCQRVIMYQHDSTTDTSAPLAATGMTPEQEAQWRASPIPPLSMGLPTAMITKLRAGESVIIDLASNPKMGRFDTRQAPLVPLRIGTELVGTLAYDYGGADHEFTPDELALAEAVAQLAALIIERDQLLHERETAHAHVLALEVAQQRMDTFLGLASHEMRTPITVCKGNLQIIERFVKRLPPTTFPEGPERLQHLLGLTERSGQQIRRIERLIADLLDVTRIQENQLTLRVARHDLRTIAAEARQEQLTIWPQRTITVVGDLAQPLSVAADADRLGQVLTNFLSNALKYSPPQSPVVIRLIREKSFARVAVQDSGPGISPSEQAAIWERFYRAPDIEHQSGSQVGLGLGLFICQNIVQQHGGQFGVASAPGEGATFWFTLPLMEEELSLHH